MFSRQPSCPPRKKRARSSQRQWQRWSFDSAALCRVVLAGRPCRVPARLLHAAHKHLAVFWFSVHAALACRRCNVRLRWCTLAVADTHTHMFAHVHTRTCAHRPHVLSPFLTVVLSLWLVWRLSFARCSEAVAAFQCGYLWHRDPMQLRVAGGGTDATTTGAGADAGAAYHLEGKTEFGDNIEDEWFIVYLLQHVTKHVPGVRVHCLCLPTALRNSRRALPPLTSKLHPTVCPSPVDIQVTPRSHRLGTMVLYSPSFLSPLCGMRGRGLLWSARLWLGSTTTTGNFC